MNYLYILMGICFVLISAGCDEFTPPCENEWFFRSPVPVDCPIAPAQNSRASVMQFEHGLMLWVEAWDSILVLYQSETQPRWQQFEDQFEDGGMEIDPDRNVDQPPYTYQPRRGMGLVWREHADVRSRLGWALAEYEFPFTAVVQMAANDTMIVSERQGGYYVLSADGRDWALYDG